MQYLAAKKPERGLLPSDARAHADVTRWQFWDACHFAPALGTLVFEKLIKPRFGMGDPDAQAIQHAIASFHRFGAVLDQRLVERSHLVGERLTLADLTLASSLMYARELDVPLRELRAVEAWFARIQALDAWTGTGSEEARRA